MKNFMKWALCSIVGLVLGVLLTIQHYAIKETIEERQREKEEFEITGILENGKRDDKNLKIMGKKKKYDRINDFSNYKKEWESA